MMSEISCAVCFGEFDEINFIPKSLECGHCLCFTCLKKIFNTMRKCPECLTKMTKTDLGSFPTNYPLLNINKTYKEFVKSDWNVKYRLEKVKSGYGSIQNQLREYVMLYNRATNGISELEEWMKKGYNELEIESTNTKLKDLEKELADTKIALQNVNQITPDFFSKGEASEQELVKKIHKGLQQGEEFYAAKIIGENYKYGKLTIDPAYPDMIFIHALTQSTVNVSKNIVMFQNLKKCILKRTHFSFIEVFDGSSDALNTVPRKLIIKMTDSALASQFMKLCSGEFGSSYKGATYNRGVNSAGMKSIMAVIQYYTGSDANCHGPIDYTLGLYYDQTTITYGKGSTIMEAYGDGSFNVIEIDREKAISCFDVAGELINKVDFTVQYNDFSQISESGIVIPLDLQERGLGRSSPAIDSSDTPLLVAAAECMNYYFLTH